MIKGCQKKIVFLKDTESELFEEAYFVLKPTATSKGEEDIVLEATRIVRGYEPKRGKAKRSAKPIIPFILGACAGALFMLIIHFILI